jgi:hypothetical protein
MDNMTYWADEQNCEMDCWQMDDCAWNNTSYDYCMESECYDNCTYEIHCFVDWIDANGYEETTPCEAFYGWANSTGPNFTYDEDEDWEGDCAYECTWNRSCMYEFDWFEVCDIYDCFNNCTGEYECIVDWMDQSFNGDYDFCDDFYDWFGNDTDDDTDDDCQEECSEPSEC